MPRRYRRRYARVSRPLKTVKYSNETVNCGNYITKQAEVPLSGTSWLAMVPPISSQGMRKCKNFTLHIETQAPFPVLFALVYVPQGNEPQNLNVGTFNNTADNSGTVSSYEPNQNVILSGIVKTDSPQLTFRTRLARNLNSGDGIALVYRSLVNDPDPGSWIIFATLNYAITY